MLPASRSRTANGTCTSTTRRRDTEYEPDCAVLKAKDQAETTVPGDRLFAFLGAVGDPGVGPASGRGSRAPLPRLRLRGDPRR